MSATIASTITADQMRVLGYSVDSSAINRWAIIFNAEGMPELLILFNSGDTVYRYAFRDADAVNNWKDLRAEDDLYGEISWGKAFHRALRSGDLIAIAV